MQNNKLFSTFLAVSLVIAACFAVPPIEAQSEKLGFLVVDVQEVLRRSKAFASLREQAEASQARYQAEIDAQQEDVRQRDQQLVDNRASMEADAFEAQANQLKAEVQQLQNYAKQRQSEIETFMEEGYEQIRIKLVGVIGQMAEERGAEVVLSKSGVILMLPQYDGTAQALAELDRVYPAVETQ